MNIVEGLLIEMLIGGLFVCVMLDIVDKTTKYAYFDMFADTLTTKQLTEE